MQQVCIVCAGGYPIYRQMGSRPGVSGLRYLSATTLPGLDENTKVNVRARRLGSTEWLSPDRSETADGR